MKKYNVEGLNTLSKDLHQFQIDAGFTDSSITQRLMLVHSEISEAFDAFRKDKYAKLKNFVPLLPNEEEGDEWKRETHSSFSFESNIKDTLEDEIADSIIRLLAFCGENEIDIEKHLELKIKYNQLRGFKYGGKKF